MTGILSGALPAGWRRPDPAPWRDPAEVAVTVERLAYVEPDGHGGERVPTVVNRDVKPDNALCNCGHPRFMHCAVAGCCAQNLDESECECAAFVPQPTRAERIEAAARALLAAQTDCEVGVDGAPRRAFAALAALRAALCSCTAHGPDLACVEHGEALRAWQKENGT